MAEIPFNKPYYVGTEQGYIAEALQRWRIAGDGHFTRTCQALLEAELGVPRVLLTTSCTHALEMAALLLDLAPGDEVIVPSFTFVSTINAFVLRGARPVFADIRADTLNLDETLVPGLITERTRALVPVHYAGVGCEMAALLDVARAHNVAVIEDNAHGLFGKWRGRWLGTFGALATLSFHETKNVSCGEGGALLINEPAYLERAEIIREKGTNRCRFFRGEVDKYTWVEVGSSYLPSDLLAAFLYGQLEARADIQQKRAALWNNYARHLADWAAEHGVGLPVVPPQCEQPYHMFYLVMPDLDSRTRLIAQLKAQDLHAVFHYQPLHTSAMGQHLGGRPGQCPVTEAMADRLLRLPFYNAMTAAEQERVVAAIREFRP